MGWFHKFVAHPLDLLFLTPRLIGTIIIVEIAETSGLNRKARIELAGTCFTLQMQPQNQLDESPVNGDPGQHVGRCYPCSEKNSLRERISSILTENE